MILLAIAILLLALGVPIGITVFCLRDLDKDE